MDFEKRMRRQSFRVIISEAIMVVTVIVMVAVLALVVSGYWLGSDFKVERQGMLQINSLPTGASVAVDGDAPWYQRTNTSKVLSSGEHHIVLTRDGYDSWEKTVDIREGLLYRLHYPRLFLANRDKASVYDATATTYATVSKDTNTMLLANPTTDWTLLKLDSDNLEPKHLDIAPYFDSVSLAPDATAGLYSGSIISSQWSGDNAHLLIQSRSGDSDEWVLLDIKNPKNSVNLTREFATNFTDMRIYDDSAGQLLAVRNDNLHRIDVPARQISAAIIKNIQSYDFYDREIVYVASVETTADQTATDKTYEIGIAKDGDITAFPEIAADATTRAYLSRFYDSKYLTVVTGGRISVYQRDEVKEPTIYEADFIPTDIKVSLGGDFVFLGSGTQVAVVDMESLRLVDWSLDTAKYHWLDSHMLYTVNDGTLSVYDYDGLNHRTLSTGVSSRFPVAITNNKWLYYFSDNEIMREIIAR